MRDDIAGRVSMLMVAVAVSTVAPPLSWCVSWLRAA
jgi:hypothetical protein